MRRPTGAYCTLLPSSMSPRGKLARSLLSTSHLHHQKHYTPSYRFLSSQSVLPKARPIPISEAPSLDYFRDHILSADRPHLLRSTISSWSALQKWKDVRGLKREKAASLVIPVEVAKIPYTAEAAPGYNAQESDQWSRVEMPYDVFLDAFMAPETEVAKVVSQAGEKLKDPRTLARSDSYRDRWVGYMAQFPLLDEVRLRCCFVNCCESLIIVLGAVAQGRCATTARIPSSRAW